MVERSPEKAGVGGSTPSLATTKSTTSKHRNSQFCPTLSQNNLKHFRLAGQAASQLFRLASAAHPGMAAQHSLNFNEGETHANR